MSTNCRLDTGEGLDVGPVKKNLSWLDNPIWHSLNTGHSHLAIGGDRAKRYPAEFAPFVALENESFGSELLDLVAVGERVGAMGVIPELTSDWMVCKAFEGFQYVWDKEFDPVWEPEAVALTEAHIPAMLELTQMVYPSYFRRGTALLGQYFGILKGDRLCAMAGVRMTMTGFQEISGVCTHLEERGNGYAGRLSRHLISHIQHSGDVPFLHTESDNLVAQSVYERLGMSFRRVIPFRMVERV
jgi:ribosomal protein S18 acetylase RimI-like enzyme